MEIAAAVVVAAAAAVVAAEVGVAAVAAVAAVAVQGALQRIAAVLCGSGSGTSSIRGGSSGGSISVGGNGNIMVTVMAPAVCEAQIITTSSHVKHLLAMTC